MAKINFQNGDTLKRDAKLTDKKLANAIKGHIALRRRAKQGMYPNSKNVEQACDEQLMRYRNEFKRRRAL